MSYGGKILIDVGLKKGDKVVYRHLNSGYYQDQEKAAKHLTLEEVYTIENIDAFGWSTNVYLVEKPYVSFNIVMFDKCKQLLKAEIIDDHSSFPLE